jgi:hypothetical protein
VNISICFAISKKVVLKLAPRNSNAEGNNGIIFFQYRNHDVNLWITKLNKTAIMKLEEGESLYIDLK